MSTAVSPAGGHGSDLPRWTERETLARRGPKNRLDPFRPYAWFVEPECSAAGVVEDVAVLLLTNRECPFRCLMCDLWRNTLDERVPDGAVTRQIDFALSQLPPVRHVKLYNSGNFFDSQAIPSAEHAEIARRLLGMRTVIVENHPRLCGDACLRFRDRLEEGCELEIALGLETVHPDVLERLNKRMTVGDFERAARFLGRHGIATRAFVLLRPPLLSEAEGIDWALRSLDGAFAAGARCACVIPTRAGNGLLEQLRLDGHFEPPRLRSLEHVLETALRWNRGRVLADLWDAERLAGCEECRAARLDRLRDMNLSQRIPAPIVCHCESSAGASDG